MRLLCGEATCRGPYGYRRLRRGAWRRGETRSPRDGAAANGVGLRAFSPTPDAHRGVRVGSRARESRRELTRALSAPSALLAPRAGRVCCFGAYARRSAGEDTAYWFYEAIARRRLGPTSPGFGRREGIARSAAGCRAYVPTPKAVRPGTGGAPGPHGLHCQAGPGVPLFDLFSRAAQSDRVRRLLLPFRATLPLRTTVCALPTARCRARRVDEGVARGFRRFPTGP